MITTTKPIWVLDVPFEWRAALSAAGASWDAALKESVYRGDRLPPQLEPFKAKPLSLGWHRQYHANKRHLEPLSSLSPAMSPRPHQESAATDIRAAMAAGAPGFLLADEVGVGKTISTWWAARNHPLIKTVLIVTTANACSHWTRTIRACGWGSHQSVIVINYDRLGKLFSTEDKDVSKRRKGLRKRVAKMGTPPAFDLVVFDESHKGKNLDSARGLMMRKLAEKATFCVWASATAGQNPVELIYLNRLLAFSSGRPVPAQDLATFADWCSKQGLSVRRGDYGKIVWDHNEADLTRIHAWLFEGTPRTGLRRRPEQISGWPAIHRQIRVQDLAPDKMASYAKMWDAFVAQDMALRASTGPSILLEKNKQRLRQESSWLRCDATVSMVSDLLEQGIKVAVSVAYLATQDEIVRQLQGVADVAVINGRQPPDEKERQRMAFQAGTANVMVFTVEEAISLHEGECVQPDAKRVLLIHDIRPSAIQMSQIEGRCHRDGKLAPVFWLTADTAELDIAEVMLNRLMGMKALHADPLDDMRAVEAVLRARIAEKAPVFNR